MRWGLRDQHFYRLSAVVLETGKSRIASQGTRHLSHRKVRMGTVCSRRAPNTESRNAVQRYLAERRSVARNRFITAVRRVINLLRLRRKWASYGRVLQEAPRCYLWHGLERRAGKLIRIHPAQDAPLPTASSSHPAERVVYSYSPETGVTSRTYRVDPKAKSAKRGRGAPKPRP